VRDLHRNDRGKEVSDVQVRLRAQGFELGTEGIDGFFGPHTELALKAFQQRRGLLIDGVVGPNTWRELVESGRALGDRLLYLRAPNQRGDDVLELQVKLNLLGFNAGPERGIYDEGVERAVLDFQRNAGLTVDGIVGRRTIAALHALRKAESGREGKKIPERDFGYSAVKTLAGQTVVVDPGHGGADTGIVSPDGLAEKDLVLWASLRLADLLRAEGSHVVLTRDRDESVALYARAERAVAAEPSFVLSLHCNGLDQPAAGGAVCSFFQRNHYFSEHGRRLADAIGGRLTAEGLAYLASVGRNYAILREPKAVAVLVEPVFLTNPREAVLAARRDFPERLAVALAQGLKDYVSCAVPAGEAGRRGVRTERGQGTEQRRGTA
jgi:N-acetylmuramoyl-L-alanine amidase